MLASEISASDTFVFVAADQAKARNATLACLPDGVRANSTEVAVFDESARSKRDNLQADLDALLDLGILTRTSDLIGSSRETVSAWTMSDAVSHPGASSVQSLHFRLRQHPWEVCGRGWCITASILLKSSFL